MKNVSPAALAIMAAGQYLKVEGWSIEITNGGTLYNGTTYYYSASDTSFKAGYYDGSSVVSPQTFNAGWTIVRDQITQKVGIQTQTLDLYIQPQNDYPGGAPQIAGGGLLAQLGAGALDGAIWTLYKGFFNRPTSGNQLDTSPGLIKWWVGVTETGIGGRFEADITLSDLTSLLNVQMPRNIIQAGCVHTLFDAGCTLSRAAFTATGSISGTITANSFNTGLTAVDDYYDLGIIKFTSGVLNGSTMTVAKYAHTGGNVRVIKPFPSLPSTGDTFSISPGCDKQQATCTNKFSNLAHFRGCPYVPQPETLYDGGSTVQPTKMIGGQGGGSIGSPFQSGQQKPFA